MGGTISYDFRSTVAHGLTHNIAVNDHERWRVLFRTAMTNDELGAYCPPSDLRKMCDQQPTTFANLIIVCSQQLAQMVMRSLAADVVSAPTEDTTPVLDETSALNAIRMLAVALPVVLAHDARTDLSPFGDALLRRSQVPVKADGSVTSAEVPILFPLAVRDQFPNFFGTQHRTSLVKMCFGDELVVALTLALFVPGFTQDVVSVMVLAESEAKRGGLIPTSTRSLRHRYETFRCLLGAMSSPVVTGHVQPALESNWLASRWINVRVNPMVQPLFDSIVAYSAHYVARGVLPYTSHYGAELPEAVLAEGLCLLNVLLAYVPVPGPNHAAWMSLDAAVAADLPQLMASLVDLSSIALYATGTTLRGSQRVATVREEVHILMWWILNRHTTPVLSLLFPSSPPVASSLLPALGVKFVQSLLFTVYDGLTLRSHFAAMYLALTLLLKLSEAANAFRAALSLPPDSPSFVPLPAYFLKELTNLKGSTHRDLSITVLCELIGPSAPIWCHPCTEVASAILVVLCSGDEGGTLSSSSTSPTAPDVESTTATPLTEATYFELFHLLDYVTCNEFLSPHLRCEPGTAKHRAISQRCERVCTNICSAVVHAVTSRPVSAVPLIACFSTLDIAERLDAIQTTGSIAGPTITAAGAAAVAVPKSTAGAQVSKEMEVLRPGDASSGIPGAVGVATPVVFSSEGRASLPVMLMRHLREMSIQAASSLAPSSKDGKSAGGGYDALSALVGHTNLFDATRRDRAPAARTGAHLHENAALFHWMLATAWGLVHERHIRPPLFAEQASRIFASQ